uniref:Site-specific DNA-methyltransferase (adenine-specific) n=1 Tax=Elaeophora elaphi TaxID=1147741 RepID=A0A0R3S6H4_9BILA
MRTRNDVIYDGTNRNIAYQGKIKARNEGRKEFLANCPNQYDFIMAIIDRLNFADQPNYSDIYKLLDQVPFGAFE